MNYTIEQSSTRGDGIIVPTELFERDDIDFSGALDYMLIHTTGEIAGSQFNGQLFESPITVVRMARIVLPEVLHYDQHGRAELTIASPGTVFGFSGVQPVSELTEIDGVQFVWTNRLPDGEPDVVDGMEGAWYPEISNPNNKHAKFEPKARIARIGAAALPDAMATDRMTLIIQKHLETKTPTVLTMLPGKNAPAFPAYIKTEKNYSDTLHQPLAQDFWNQHAFVELLGSNN